MNENEETFDERFGLLPIRTLRVIKRFNVSQSDFDCMLMRWGYHYGQAGIPWSDVERHIITHAVNGNYRYPMYED